MHPTQRVFSSCSFSTKLILVSLIFMMSLGLAKGKLVDLTHRLNSRSAHYPVFRDFELTSFAKGNSADLGGIWVEANDIALSEHTGTHIDAPVHTWKTGIHVDEIPASDLIGPAIVINVTQKSLQDPDYKITVQDLIDFEQEYGQMPNGSIVLVKADRSKYYWSDRTAYLGSEDHKNHSSLHNPGFSAESINWLIANRNIKGIGTDCYNFDAGSSRNLEAHVAILGGGRFGIENANNVDKLPPIGATIFVMVIPIEGGSGAPARIVAFWDSNYSICSSSGIPEAYLALVVTALFFTVRRF